MWRVSMSWQASWRCVCDLCVASGPRRSGRTPSADAEAAALKAGWVAEYATERGGRAHLCPACAAKERPEWWPAEESKRKGAVA